MPVWVQLCTAGVAIQGLHRHQRCGVHWWQRPQLLWQAAGSARGRVSAATTATHTTVATASVPAPAIPTRTTSTRSRPQSPPWTTQHLVPRAHHTQQHTQHLPSNHTMRQQAPTQRSMRHQSACRHRGDLLLRAPSPATTPAVALRSTTHSTAHRHPPWRPCSSRPQSSDYTSSSTTLAVPPHITAHSMSALIMPRSSPQPPTVRPCSSHPSPASTPQQLHPTTAALQKTPAHTTSRTRQLTHSSTLMQQQPPTVATLFLAPQSRSTPALSSTSCLAVKLSSFWCTRSLADLPTCRCGGSGTGRAVRRGQWCSDLGALGCFWCTRSAAWRTCPPAVAAVRGGQ